MSEPPPTRSAFDMITRGPFSRLWWSSVVGSTGDWITVFATIALGDNIAGEAGVVVALVSRILPGLFLGAAVGVITDRVDRRKLVVISDLSRGLIVPFLLFATTLPILVAINVLIELFSLLGQPPRNAMLPRLVRKENLVTANSLMLGATYGTVPVGAGLSWFLVSLPTVTLGGFIPVETATLTLAFLLDSVTFFTSAALIASLPVIRSKLSQRRVDDGRTEGGRALAELVEGVKFFWQRRSVRRVIAGMTVALVGGGTMVVLGKSFVETVLLEDQTGFFAIITAMGVGAGTGIGVVSLYESRLPQRDLSFAFFLILTGVGLAAASLTDTVFGASAWMFVMGFGAGAAYVMGLTHLHEEVSDELRGRVFATLFGLMRIGLFVSMALAPPLVILINRYGLARMGDARRIVLFLGGAIIVLSGLTMLWSLRELLGKPHIGEGTRAIVMRTNEARRALLGERSRRGAEDDTDPGAGKHRP